MCRENDADAVNVAHKRTSSLSFVPGVILHLDLNLVFKARFVNIAMRWGSGICNLLTARMQAHFFVEDPFVGILF